MLCYCLTTLFVHLCAVHMQKGGRGAAACLLGNAGSHKITEVKQCLARSVAWMRNFCTDVDCTLLLTLLVG